MRYYVFSFDGYGLAVAWQLQQEGCDVTIAMIEDQADTISEIEKNVPPEDEKERARRLSQYHGLMRKITAKQAVEEIQKAKDPKEVFAFFDLNHLFLYAEQVEKTGCHGNFPTAEDYRYEIDRELAKGFVQKNYPAIHVAENKRFKKASEAKAFLAESEDLWVLKGLAENARTVVPDVEDVELAGSQILDALAQHSGDYESAGFILELLIPSMIELTPERVYHDGVPVATVMCIENKPMGAGNVGPMTDCSQDLVFALELDDKINQMAFPPVIDEMAKQHRGLFFWDASLLVDSRTGKVYFGEYCPNRPGYNCLFTEMSLAGGASKYFESLIQGKSPYSENSCAASMRIFNFHKQDGTLMAGGTIDYKPRIEKDLWLVDVRMQGSRRVNAGYQDGIAVITGAGKSVMEAARRAQRNIDEFSFEGAYYRPQFDFTSREYRTSILNRLDYGLQRGFYKIAFGIG
jgi:hypothetical protein